MKVINARNVNDALLLGIDLFQDSSNFREQESRNGTTYEALEPVTTVYNKPFERVCLLKERDANPFFHLIESLWMLQGSNKLPPLTYFVKSMEDFSDDGETLWGAYGWRWKSYFNKDQLDIIIQMLKTNPEDRRCVLQMWDPVLDLNKVGKDVPCNTNIYFKIREGKLNMTVCCRSNDMVWGAYGANVVHMSVLQEYLATAIGVEIGTYRQISDSFHVYLNDVWERLKVLEIDPYTFSYKKNPYDLLIDGYKPFPLITNIDTFHWELYRYFNYHPNDIQIDTTWENPVFKDIAVPMTVAYTKHKQRNYMDSYQAVSKIKALDWMTACFDWIRKRDTSYTLNNAEKGETHEQ
tara:strand:- start:7060 stop:8112 length:1053 start_codon:yes stop_codon:yes gene_type:complete